ncbi:helix-turn-helix domain-containing protein [Actinosynnema mirum]|uniref:Transcriptional regulator, XRE family n=1 Tax=Actinosynnema mirum (strain ATCC 29888 / DSM 43827 / JCM 3225 / NBRC 14064 / NCIMB 13271 / NRRL B-12336 / IMRU 3971 / 101) TaxID=446462 RepID=C6WNL9_ACTMD|nr:helix-turn-helix transcriptional regulator [Actinosynnema mirum]ACU34938.1 transcriptional regulator, XRE family [Actinosynnema mirum DSM 43827]
MTQHEAFGIELRRRRNAAGLSLQGLAKELNYSKGHLSKIETGAKAPTPQLARQADAVLSAGGELSRLAPQTPVGHPRQAVPAPRHEAPPLPRARRSELEAATEDPAVAQGLRLQFDTIRDLGKRMSPRLVQPMLHGSLVSLRDMLAAAGEAGAKRRVALMTARFVEYAGWMAQEAGRREEAVALTLESAALAELAGDPGLAAYALVRRAELAMYAGAAQQTIALAERALADPHATARVRGLAEHRLAQGFAQLGEEARCRAALERAAALLAEAAAPEPVLPEETLARATMLTPPAAGRADVPASGLVVAPARGPAAGRGVAPVVGSSTVADLDAVVTGWCLYDLGRPAEAARLLERGLAGTSPEARRARALYGVRLALAHEAAGELDRMHEVALESLDTARALGSDTVRSQLRNLAWMVQRRHSHRPSRDLHVEITAALQDGVVD